MGWKESKGSSVMLDEKYFRRLDKFNGDIELHRGWSFDPVMALNQLDSSLSKEINKVLGACGNEGEKWDHEGRMDPDIWERYHNELYTVISGLTTGTAKTALKGLYDRDRKMDGFKVLVVFQSRFDIQTVGGMIQAFVEVVKPALLRRIRLWKVLTPGRPR